MSNDTAYRELGLAPGASEAEIKAAWRRLVSRWHPDRNGSRAAVEKMQRINQAFELLRAGLADIPPPAPDGEAPSPAAAQRSAEDEPAADTHADDAAASVRPLQRRVKLTLEEAAHGCVRVLRGQLAGACAGCAGAGLRWPGGECPSCEGSGRVHQRTWYGWSSSTVVCEDCAGDGRARVVCTPCDGTGKLPPQRYELKVRIPAGVRDGDLLAVPPDRRRTGPPGGIDLRIELLPHPLFALEPDGTVRCECPVDGFRWIAGRDLEVPTLDGLETFTPTRRDDVVYRLPGRGFPATRRGARADFVLTLRPTFPHPLSNDQQILLDRLIATTTQAGKGPLADWQQRVRQWSRTVGEGDGATPASAKRPASSRRGQARTPG